MTPLPTINVDAAEVASLLADEKTINNQEIIVNNPITVDQANDLAATTTGVIKATIVLLKQSVNSAH